MKLILQIFTQHISITRNQTALILEIKCTLLNFIYSICERKKNRNNAYKKPYSSLFIQLLEIILKSFAHIYMPYFVNFKPYKFYKNISFGDD